MSMVDPQLQADAKGVAGAESSEFASLLQREFKPKSEEARDAVVKAVEALAKQALSQT